MKNQRRTAAILASILCVCFLCTASGATLVDKDYYETLLAELAPEPEAPAAFPDEVLAQYQTISVGDKGEHVQTLKDRMYELGYFRNQTDHDTFTRATAEYVELFQEINGIEVTGIATPDMQALFYSENALPGPNAEGYSETLPDLQITDGKIVKLDSNGSGFQLNVQNNSDRKIATYYIIAIPYNADGEPVEMADTLEDQLYMAYAVDDYGISSGGKIYGLSCRFAFVLSESVYYPGVIASIYGYETEDGEFVVLCSQDNAWYGCGDGVPNGSYIPEAAAATTHPTEAELAAAADWSVGLEYLYVPVLYSEYYNVPEGLYLDTVLPGSAAAAAGLQSGDILISLGDTLTNCETSYHAAKGRIADGETADALYWRDGGFYLTEVAR